MVSASAIEEHRTAIALPYHDAFIMKPIDIARLTETIVGLLALEVKHEAPSESVPASNISLDSMELPDQARLVELIDLCEIGFIRGLREALAEIGRDERYRPFADHLMAFVDAIDLRGLMAALESVSEPAA